MKTLRTLLVIAIAIFVSAQTSIAQDGKGTTINDAKAYAKVFQVLTIAKTQALDFGSFGASSDARDVIINAETGGRTGSANLVTVGGITPKNAIFTITGEKSTTINFVIPPTVDLNATGGTMTATLTSYPATLTSISLSVTDGTAVVNLGGTLVVRAGQAAGDYVGTYEVTANYN